jgi:hypothetical protein
MDGGKKRQIFLFDKNKKITKYRINKIPFKLQSLRMFEPIKKVLDRVLANKNSAQTFSAAEACAFVEKLFLAEIPQISGKFHAKFVRNSTLTIAATSSAASNELRLAETIVLSELQLRFPRIKKIRYVINYK